MNKTVVVVAPANAMSTSHYYLRALRRAGCQVVHVGPPLAPAKLDQWRQLEQAHALKDYRPSTWDRFGMTARLTPPPDVPTGWAIDARQLEIHADALVWIDGGEHLSLTNLDAVQVPTACILGDLHTGQDWKREFARQFDHRYVQFNRPACGAIAARWLPPACEPAIHGFGRGLAKVCDVAFVGQTLLGMYERRIRVLAALVNAGLSVRVESAVLEEAAMIYGRARIGFNCSLAGDYNMRVPEVLASGAVLLTDRLAPEAGLEQHYTHGQHLLLYDTPEEAVELARKVLAVAPCLRDLAAAGQARVLASHTYDHRVAAILGDLFPEDAP